MDGKNPSQGVRHVVLLVGISVATLATANVAAQTASRELDEVVVTGTLIKGIDKPVGTNIVGLSQEDIVASGVTSGVDLLTKIPQLANFNALPAPGTANSNLPFTPPSIRGLGGLSSMSTLVLVDGHRVVTQGIEQTWIDASMIPAGHLARVEVVPDGGSSIYGSDAIGGVINYITKRKIDRPEVSARYGIADKYATVDVNAATGFEWGSGSFAVSGAYAHHDALFGRDRDYTVSNHSARGGQDFRVTNCNPGNVTVGAGAAAITYPLPGTTAGVANRCANALVTSFYPDEDRASGYITLSQEISDRITLDVPAYYSWRETVSYGCCNENATGVIGNGTITSANPYFQSRAGETSQAVFFTYADVFGTARRSPSVYSALGITPTLSIGLTDEWDLKVSGNYGRSKSDIKAYGINTGAQAAALAATTTTAALNPYNPAASNPAVLAAIGNQLDFSGGHQTLAEAKALVSGQLFALSGGAVRIAAGTEWRRETDTYVRTNGVAGGPLIANVDASREVTSLFAELFIPVVQKLELSASVRYDNYSDVGNTTNPKFGFSYEPVEQLTVRGNWGTSFHAPGLGDFSFPRTLTYNPVSTFRETGSPPSDLQRPTFILGGGRPDMKPETADTWSVGADWRPVPGIVASLTYWNIDYKDRIDLNPYFAGGPYYTDPLNVGFFIRNPTLAQVAAFQGDATLIGISSIAAGFAGAAPYVVIDGTRTNLGRLRTNGLDFNVKYSFDLAGGEVSANVSGTYYLKRETQRITGAAFVDNLANNFNDLTAYGSLGYRRGSVNVQASVTYSDSFPILNDPVSSSVEAYYPLALFASYDLPGDGFTRDTQLTLNLDNVFDSDPPFRANANGVQYRNIGRMVSAGVRKKF